MGLVFWGWFSLSPVPLYGDCIGQMQFAGWEFKVSLGASERRCRMEKKDVVAVLF